MTEREAELAEALRGILRAFVPSRDRFSSAAQHEAFSAAQKALDTVAVPDITRPDIADVRDNCAIYDGYSDCTCGEHDE